MSSFIENHLITFTIVEQVLTNILSPSVFYSSFGPTFHEGKYVLAGLVSVHTTCRFHISYLLDTYLVYFDQNLLKFGLLIQLWDGNLNRSRQRATCDLVVFLQF